MSLEDQRKGQIGINVVERIVLQDWRGRWQQIDSVNDDGIDGLIFLESRGVPTGQIIFVQVKCRGGCKANKSGVLSISINRDQLKMNFERWKRVVGAAIFVHVDPVTLEARWVNLRDRDALGNTQVFVPATNTFDIGARRTVAALCGTIHHDFLVRHVDTSASDFNYLVGKDHIQTAARAFYREMQRTPVFLGQSDKCVSFTREGWHHITRRNRPRLTQLQSFQLLGAVRRIIRTASEEEIREIRPKRGQPVKFVSLSAAVSFPFRGTAIVKILLRKRCDPNVGVNYSFYTAYEPRRRRSIVGVKKESARA